MFSLRTLSRTSRFRNEQQKQRRYNRWSSGSNGSQRRSWRRYSTEDQNPPKRDDSVIVEEDSPSTAKTNGFNPLLPIAVIGAAAVAAILAYLPPFSNKPLNVKKETLKKLDNIYKQYASITIDGEKYMTKGDFIASINLTGDTGKGKNGKRKPKPPTPETDGTDTDPFNTLFRPRESSGEKTISFSEFVFFDTLLATSEKEFETAFKLFDTEGDGYCSKDEFRSLMRACGHLTFAFTSGYWDNFFGQDGENRISLKDFTRLIADLKIGLLQQEFSQFKKSNGMLSAKDFTTLVAINTNPKMLPKHTHQNLESVDEAYADCQISLDDYANFHKVLDNFPAFEKALRMTNSVAGLGVGRSQLGRVTQQTADTLLSTNQLDVLFHIFDNPRRHSMLDVDTFLYVMKDRSNMRLFDIHRLNAATNNKTPMQKLLLAAKSFGIGAVAGAIGATAVYPIDLVKTRMQNQRGSAGDASAAKQMYKNSWDCFTQVIKNEGPTGLYRGLLPQLVGVAPEKAIKLVVNDLLRGLFQQAGQSEDSMYLPLEILAGGCAGMSQVVFTNPIEIVKIRLQVQGELATRYGLKPKGAVTIVRELGFFGLYKGAPACFSRDIPFSAIYFPLYAKSKQLMRDADTGEESAMNYLLAGSFAGLISASMTTPFDVVKTRLQVEARAGDQTYNGIVDCFVKVYRSEGILAFYKGIVPRCIRSSPQFGVTLLAYELLQNFFDPEHDIAPQPPTPAPVQTAARPSLIQESDEDQMIGSWGLAPN